MFNYLNETVNTITSKTVFNSNCLWPAFLIDANAMGIVPVSSGFSFTDYSSVTGLLHSDSTQRNEPVELLQLQSLQRSTWKQK